MTVTNNANDVVDDEDYEDEDAVDDSSDNVIDRDIIDRGVIDRGNDSNPPDGTVITRDFPTDQDYIEENYNNVSTKGIYFFEKLWF